MIISHKIIAFIIFFTYIHRNIINCCHQKLHEDSICTVIVNGHQNEESQQENSTTNSSCTILNISRCIHSDNNHKKLDKIKYFTIDEYSGISWTLETKNVSQTSLKFDVMFKFRNTDTSICYLVEVSAISSVENIYSVNVKIPHRLTPVIMEDVDVIYLYVISHKSSEKFLIHQSFQRSHSNVLNVHKKNTSNLSVIPNYDADSFRLMLLIYQKPWENCYVYAFKQRESTDNCSWFDEYTYSRSVSAKNQTYQFVSIKCVTPGLYCIRLRMESCRSSSCFVNFRKPFHAENKKKRSLIIKEKKDVQWNFTYYANLIDFGTGIHLTFSNFNPVSSSMKYEIRVMKGLSSHDDSCSFDFHGSYYTIKMINSTNVTFRDLKPGNYCMRVQPKHPDCLKKYSIHRGSCEKYPIRYTHIIQVQPFVREEAILTHRKRLNISEFNYQSLLFILVILFLIPIILLVKMYLIKKKIQLPLELNSRENNTLFDVECSEIKKSNVSVFLLYTKDNDLHVKVILSFVELLKSFGCTVYHIMDEECLGYIHLDSTTWFRNQVLENYTNGKNHKVIWIASKLACHRFEALKNFKDVSIDDDFNENYSIGYDVAVRMLLMRIFESHEDDLYSKIAIVQLPYYLHENIMNGVLMDRRFCLPNRMDQLVEFIFDRRIASSHLFEDSHQYFEMFTSAIDDVMQQV